jgi:hypothetical protein
MGHRRIVTLQVNVVYTFAAVPTVVFMHQERDAISA